MTPATSKPSLGSGNAEHDEDAAESDVVRQEFLDELQRRGHDVETDAVWLPVQAVAEIVNQATREKRPTNKAIAYLRTPTILGSCESRRGDSWMRLGMEGSEG